MDVILKKFQDLVACSVLKQFPIHRPIFPLHNPQRPILTNLLAKMAIIYNGKGNLRSWFFCVRFQVSMDGAVNTSRQIAGGLIQNVVRTEQIQSKIIKNILISFILVVIVD